MWDAIWNDDEIDRDDEIDFEEIIDDDDDDDDDARALRISIDRKNGGVVLDTTDALDAAEMTLDEWLEINQ